MEVYEEMENNASDAFDASATTTTPGGHQHEISSQIGQVMRERGGESEENHLESLGALRAKSWNATRRLRLYMTTGAGKSAEPAIKIFATQKLQVEKKNKMEIWKKNVMQEVGRELQVIRLRQEEAMEAQR